MTIFEIFKKNKILDLLDKENKIENNIINFKKSIELINFLNLNE